MADQIAIKVTGVSKTFKLPHERVSSLKSAIINFRKLNKTFEKQQVLHDISFEIKKGEFFGIVGRNGSGKSTLLKLLAGIYTPDSGTVEVTGKLTPFIELGVGFNPELTGKENVYLNGALLGFNRREVNEMYESIVAFAELERFMDQRLKNYSSGMQVRLAFSIAIRAQSDVLLLDEVLAVGDAAFQRKCFDHFMELKKNKQTVILVTHDMGAVKQYCDRAVMIDEGKIVKSGKPEVVAQAYMKLFIDESNEKEELAQSNAPEDIQSEDRWGNGKMKAVRAHALVTDVNVEFSCRFTAAEALPSPILGFSVYNPSGLNVVEGNTQRTKTVTKALSAGDSIEYKWTVPNIFANGKYTVSFACCDQSAMIFYDWLNKAATFTVNKQTTTGGLFDPLIKTEEIT